MLLPKDADLTHAGVCDVVSKEPEIFEWLVVRPLLGEVAELFTRFLGHSLGHKQD
jgi:hypothetical protein